MSITPFRRVPLVARSGPGASQAPRLKCSECGVEVNAGCACGVPYVQAVEKLAELTEQRRQARRTYDEKKRQEKQHASDIRNNAAVAPPTESRNFEDDTFEPDEDVEESGKVLINILDSIKQYRAVGEAYRKILKRSPFDREAKKEINDAIESLIRKWRSVQSTLTAKENDDTPSGSGSTPEGAEARP
jgi:hypothetical protein